MTARRLICACGAAAALLSTPLFAQSGTNPANPSRPSTDRQPTETRPTVRPTDARPASGQTSDSALLSRLEGVWKVEVSLHDAWSELKHMRQDKPAEPMTRPDPNTPRPAQPEDRNRDTTAAGTAKTFTGYSERKLVLGDNILQESIVVPDMPSGTMKTDGMRDAGPDSATQNREDEFRGMSFIAFNEPAQTYQIVFLDSMHNDIHVDSGRYDAQSRALVFHGKSDGHKSDGYKSDGQKSINPGGSGTQPGHESDPADFSRKPAGEDVSKGDSKHRAGYGDVRVVVEVMSDDQHRVTMYRQNAMATTTRPTDAQNNRPGTGQPGDAARPDDNRLTASASEAIVYRAVYTRATGAEASRYQRLIDEDRSLTRANSTDR